MNTDPDKKLDALFRAARQKNSQDAASVFRSFGFQTRLLAGIRAERQQRSSAGFFAWRLASVFAAIAIAAGAWNFSESQTPRQANRRCHSTIR
jgi:hypothetical protein